MELADWLQVFPVIVAALIAVGGWVFTYLHGFSLSRRNAKLERINRQLRELYGPLYASVKASAQTWEAFVESHWPGHGETAYFADGDSSKLTEVEKQRWVTWMKYVYQPMNEKTAELILENVDLIEGKDMPQSFLDAIAHINAYHAVLAQWEVGDFSEYTSVNNWPYQELMNDVKPVFKKLRREQVELLGASKR